mgnify:CR=1 FL=1
MPQNAHTNTNSVWAFCQKKRKLDLALFVIRGKCHVINERDIVFG